MVNLGVVVDDAAEVEQLELAGASKRVTAEAIYRGRGIILATGRRPIGLPDGVFVFIGQEPNTQMFRGVVDLDAGGYVLTGPDGETNVTGAYAAGDVV